MQGGPFTTYANQFRGPVPEGVHPMIFAVLHTVGNRYEGSISTTQTTTIDVWIRRVMFWKELRNMRVEEMVIGRNVRCSGDVLG